MSKNKFKIINFRNKMIDITLKNANILIVDDQQANIDVLEGLLEMQGYTNIKSTVDPRNVLPFLKSFEPDLILLDLSMPFLSGYEVLQQIKTFISPKSYLPVLVLTADISPEAKQNALSNGAKDFLNKPFDLIEVGLRIRNLLETRYFYQQLENSNHFLEEKVKERTSELLKTNNELIISRDKAEASDKLKSAFIQNISHEVRTPLNGILGLTNLFVDPNISSLEKSEYIPFLNDSSERLLKTITDYLDISLIMSKTVDLNLKNINLNDEIHNISSRYYKSCKEKIILLNLKLPENSDEIIIKTDLKLFRTIFTHLFDNAVKFTPNGRITLGYTLNNSKIEFYIKDTGVGINEENKNDIFRFFNQADVTDTRKYEGNGLGLSIVKGFLLLLGGDIWFESEKDSGSTFYFNLPKEEVEEDNNLNPNFKINSSKLPVILIAEDDYTNYIYFETLLKKYSSKIYHAISGLEAIEFCQKNPEISLVLMDIKMPGLNGIDATRQIKAFRNNLPIVAVSAYTMGGDEKLAMEAGCDSFISKPVRNDEFYLKLKEFGLLD